MSEHLVTVAEGSLDYVKELIRLCEREGIPVALDQCRKSS